MKPQKLHRQARHTTVHHVAIHTVVSVPTWISVAVIPTETNDDRFGFETGSTDDLTKAAARERPLLRVWNVRYH